MQLGQVKLEIEGAEARALYKVRLEHVRAILEKALDSIGEHPEILWSLSRTLDEVLRERPGQVRASLEKVLEGLEVGDAVDEAPGGGWRTCTHPRGDLGAPRWRSQGQDPWNLGRGTTSDAGSSSQEGS